VKEVDVISKENEIGSKLFHLDNDQA